MEKQVIYEISETTQQVITGLMQNIAELKQEITELRHWDEAAQETIKNLNQKIQALTTTLITHYDKSWFDQTVSF